MKFPTSKGLKSRLDEVEAGDRRRRFRGAARAPDGVAGASTCQGLEGKALETPALVERGLWKGWDH